MSDDGAKDTGEDEERPSRPETAAGRRARRRGADDADSVREPVGAGARAGGSSPAKRRDGTGPGSKGDVEEKKLPLPKRIVRYLRQVVDELRKVIWPTRKQMVTYTIVVLAFVAFMVGLVALLDWVFGKAVFALFG